MAHCQCYFFNDFGVKQECKMCQNVYKFRNCCIVYIFVTEFSWENILWLNQKCESKASNQDVDFNLSVGEGNDRLAGKEFLQQNCI